LQNEPKLDPWLSKAVNRIGDWAENVGNQAGIDLDHRFEAEVEADVRVTDGRVLIVSFMLG
jgi:hypothetical protein